MSKAVLVARGVSHGFKKKKVLDGVDFELESGAVTVLLGRNGAGKSTFMKLALGVLVPQAGTLKVLGRDPVAEPRRIRQELGFVPSVPDVPGWMTWDDVCAFLAPQYPSWSASEASSLSERLELPHDIPFRDLSRGEGMKAMLAAALAPSPRLLLLDEPFAGLDPVVREEVLRGVIASLKQQERTVLCATHDLEVTARIADRVAVLEAGRIAVHGDLESVLPERQPQPMVAGLHDLLVGSR